MRRMQKLSRGQRAVFLAATVLLQLHLSGVAVANGEDGSCSGGGEEDEAKQVCSKSADGKTGRKKMYKQTQYTLI